MTTERKLTFGSLFAGIGGFDLGFERAGMECKWQVEIDDYATRVLEKHWPDVARHRDVCTFPPQALEFSYRGGEHQQARSPQMCERMSQAENGTSMSSVADSPVRIFPMPGPAQDSKANGAGCSLRRFAWFDNSDRALLCWRTWQRCLLEGWTELSERWPRSGMTRNGIAYRLPPLVPRISGTGCSYLPTPDTGESLNGHGRRGVAKTGNSQSARNLDAMAAMNRWPTPQAADAARGADARDRPGSGGPNLLAAVKMVPTRTAGAS